MKTFYEEWAPVFASSQQNRVSALASAEIASPEILHLQLQNFPAFSVEFLSIGFTLHRTVLEKLKDLDERLFYIKRASSEHYRVESETRTRYLFQDTCFMHTLTWQRYIHHERRGSRVMLLVRELKGYRVLSDATAPKQFNLAMNQTPRIPYTTSESIRRDPPRGDENMRSRTQVEFPGNGKTIRGHVWGKAGHPQHAVILNHGFLANERMCHGYAKLLADLGFLAVTFDFCGGGIFSRSDGDSHDMTIFTEEDDLLHVIRGVKARFAPRGVSLLGCSQGGLVSAMVAKGIPEQIESLILMYPALCIPDDARRGRMLFYRFDPQSIPDTLGRFPMRLGGEYARAVINLNALDLIGGYDGPVLYLHGTKDKVVSVSYARQAQGVYPCCEYHEIAGGGHIFRGAAERTARSLLADFARGIRA